MKEYTMLKRPHVICHMMSTVDGKILTATWGDPQLVKTFGGVFETYHETFDSEAWLCGRVTMEKDFTGGIQPEPEKPQYPIAREAYIGDSNATSFAIAIDAHGKLGWESNKTGGDHIIEVLTSQVDDDYLNYLQKKGISYIFAGDSEIDCKSALEQLANLFPIKTIMLEGGGHVNGSFLNAGLIDELSLLILPIADGTAKTPTVFEVSDYLKKQPASLLTLKEVKRVEQDVIWLKYHFEKPE
jgi:riboflavin biosynthesis pyrimidine reductase